MVFSSIYYLFFFFPIFFLIYYLVPFKIKNYILLFFSLLFYAWGEPIYIILMIFSCLINYVYALISHKFKHEKLLLIICIIINVLILGFFKYADFLIGIINSIFKLNIDTLNLGLPIGISFYTFQTMSYSIDVYNNHVKAEKNFFYFSTYVSMFPQLIAGPIVRYETISDQLYKREINFEHFSNGIIRFIHGLFKKVLIANNMGLLFTSITNLNEISILSAWLGSIAFTLQIYFDFSGYSDMAIGMGEMLGFKYLENFNYPYVANSITDFWRRWHISLSTWFKDYVYIPLGGNRCKKIINIRNILIVWTLTGIWHGANYNFIIWGLYYGIILIIEKYLLGNYIKKLPNIIKHIYTLFIIVIGWVIFAFTDINLLVGYVDNMFNIFKYKFIDNIFIFNLLNYGIIILIGILLSTPIYKYFNSKIDNKLKKTVYIIVHIILLLITISCLVSDSFNPFLYFRF